MILSEKVWYTKLYFFIEDWWAYFISKDWKANKSYHTNTNLCEFMRAFILKLPILIVSPLILFGSIFFTFFFHPIYFLGFTWYIIVLLCIAGFVGIIYAVNYVHNTISQRQAEKPKSTSPSFWRLFTTWIRARKQAICPLIKIGDDK